MFGLHGILIQIDQDSLKGPSAEPLKKLIFMHPKVRPPLHPDVKLYEPSIPKGKEKPFQKIEIGISKSKCIEKNGNMTYIQNRKF